MKHALDVLSALGCPWHGLIEGAQLTLPNDTQIAMRQPAGGLRYERGNTQLIALPTAPVTARTPEQADADDAAGMQWLNQALIAGDQIHGRSIGQGHWIYHDDDSKNWLVETTLQNAGPAQSDCTVTLRRFGVFGGEPESHEYTVPVTGVEAARSWWGLNASNVQVRMYSTHPQGRAAVFAVLGLFSGAEDWRPIAWLEMTLSGAASSCIIECVVLHDAQSTRGSRPFDDSGTFTELFERYDRVVDTQITDTTVEAYPSCSGTYESVESYTFEPSGDASGYLVIPAGEYVQRSSRAACIVGIYYSPAGDLQRMTLNADITWTVTAPTPAPQMTQSKVYRYSVAASGGACARTVEEATPGHFVVSQTVTTVSAASLEFQLDGVPVMSESVTYTAVVTSTMSWVSGYFPGEPDTTGYSHVMSWDVTNDRGYAASDSSSQAGSSVFSRPWSILRPGTDMLREPRVFTSSPPQIDIDALVATASRNANGVFSIDIMTTAAGVSYPREHAFTAAVATPGGRIDVPPLSVTRNSSLDPVPLPYGSYNPITGAAARTLNSPVCWT